MQRLLYTQTTANNMACTLGNTAVRELRSPCVHMQATSMVQAAMKDLAVAACLTL
jgi:hypothetical protein